jgi:integral membrane sensor domain MASE1
VASPGVALLSLMVGLVCVVVTARWTRRLWAGRKDLPQRLQAIAALVAASAVIGPLATAVGLINTFGAVGGESMDPSQKAQILAEDTGGAMLWTAGGSVLWAASVITLIWLMSKRSEPSS